MSSIQWDMFACVRVCIFLISHISNLFHWMEWLMSLIYNGISVHRYLNCVPWRPCILISLDRIVNFGSSSNVFRKTWEPLLKYPGREIIPETKISYDKGSYTPGKHYLKRYFSTTRTPNKKGIMKCYWTLIEMNVKGTIVTLIVDIHTKIHY